MTTPTVRLSVDPAHPEDAPLEQAAARLRAGGLVAFPTETVYGLGAHALDADAVRRIFEAKQRPAHNPLIVHVRDAADARALTRAWPAQAELLTRALWPGPLTLILPRASHVPDAVTAGGDGVALRAPAHPVARRLLAIAALPIAAPSANRYTHISPTRADHVARSLGDRVAMILDGGPCQLGLESTVLSLMRPDAPELLRLGAVTREQLEAILGAPVTVRPSLESGADEGEGEGAPSPSPGLARRHYAPQALTRALDEGAWAQAPWRHDARAGLIAWQPCDPHGAHLITLPADPQGYARGLYDALHALESAACETIYLELPPRGPGWRAIHDRVRRATSA